MQRNISSDPFTNLLFAVVITLAIVSTAIWFIPDAFGRIVIGLMAFSALIFATYAFTAQRPKRYRTIRHAIKAYCTVIVSLLVGEPFLQGVFVELFNGLFGDKLSISSGGVPHWFTIIVVVLVTIFFLMVLLILKAPPPLGAVQVDPAIREPAYLEQRAIFAQELASDISRTDRDLN